MAPFWQERTFQEREEDHDASFLGPRKAMRLAIAFAVTFLVTTPVSAQDRVDLYKPDGSREGWATVDKSGRVDLYDTRPANRLRPHARRPPGVIRHSGASPEHDHSTRATWRRSPNPNTAG